MECVKSVLNFLEQVKKVSLLSLEFIYLLI